MRIAKFILTFPPLTPTLFASAARKDIMDNQSNLETRLLPEAGFPGYALRAALASSVNLVNAGTSLMAMSANILRLTCTPAFCRPFIKPL